MRFIFYFVLLFDISIGITGSALEFKILANTTTIKKYKSMIAKK